MDVVTNDKPTEDMNRYLERGLNAASLHLTNGKWKPGDLIGKKGSRPETKAKSASYAPPDQWDKISESRSATSASHIPQYDRIHNTVLGWGDYDQYEDWLAHGRQVTSEMVEKDEWTRKRLPRNCVNEAGEVVETIPPIVQKSDLPYRSRAPLTFYERFHGRDKSKDEKEEERTETGFFWAGT